MTQAALETLALDLGCGAVLGAVLGFIYFSLLRRTVVAYASAGRLHGPLLLTAARLALAAAAFWLLVQWSAAAVISALAGFTMARLWVRSPEMD